MIIYRNLDPKLPIPLYQQLKEILLHKINSGDWKTDTLIPSESELIREYKVSRTTVREAVNTLVSEGRLMKKQGKGTTVCKPKIEQILGPLMGFTERISMLGYTPGTRLIEARVMQPPAIVKEKLFYGGQEEVFYVKRIRLADHEPIAIEETYWPLKIGRLYEKEDLNTISFYPILENYGYKLSNAEEIITSGVANREEAKYLNVKLRSPLLRIHRVTYAVGGEPIQYCCNQYRSDRYSYKVQLKR
jgi:GntR family transcriptional regulator